MSDALHTLIDEPAPERRAQVAHHRDSMAGLALRVDDLENETRRLVAYIKALHANLGHLGFPEYNPETRAVKIDARGLFNDD
jgi:hypothetical protein